MPSPRHCYVATSPSTCIFAAGSVLIDSIRLFSCRRYGLQGWTHPENPFKLKNQYQPTAAEKSRAERMGVSSTDDVSDAAHYAANWLNETVRRSVAASADAETGQSSDLLRPEWHSGVASTTGILAQGRPAVDRLHDKEVEASLPVFTLSGQRSGVLGDLSDVKWQLPTPLARWDLDTADANRTALVTNLFAAIALHDMSTIEYLLKIEKLPIAGDVIRAGRGRTPLHAAVLAESPVVTGLFITNGADPNLADDDGNTPLTLCLLPDEDLLAIGDTPVSRLNETCGRATFALPLVSPHLSLGSCRPAHACPPSCHLASVASANRNISLVGRQVVLGGAELTEREWALAEKHYSFLVPHIRHYQGLDDAGKDLLKGLMDLNQTDERSKNESEKRKTWSGGHRSFGMMRSTQYVNIFYFLFGGGVLFGCAVAEGYRERWDELPFHP